jgi:hypothetical protein
MRKGYDVDFYAVTYQTFFILSAIHAATVVEDRPKIVVVGQGFESKNTHPFNFLTTLITSLSKPLSPSTPLIT